MRGNWFHPHLDISVSVSMCVFIYCFFSLFWSQLSLWLISPPRLSSLCSALCTFSRNFCSFAISLFFPFTADSSSFSLKHEHRTLFFTVCMYEYAGHFILCAFRLLFLLLLLQFSVSFINLIFFQYIYLALTNIPHDWCRWLNVCWLAGLLARSLDTHFLSMCVCICIRSQKLTFIIVVIATSNCIQIQLDCIWLI